MAAKQQKDDAATSEPAGEEAALGSVPPGAESLAKTGKEPSPPIGYQLTGAVGENVIRQEGLAGPSDQDIVVYQAGLPGWAEHQGRHVLIYGGEVCGFFETRNTALREGYRRFGRVPFLVKQVDVDEKPVRLVGVVL